MDTELPDRYYDFMLIGRTGMGKSTLGNQLLRREQSAVSERFATSSDNPLDNSLSVTATCELLSNDATNVRVLDLPGFSNSATTNQSGQRVTAYEGNLQIIDSIVRQQAENNLHVRRVVYFLPVRGVLEKADGSLQEELQVMHRLFGPNIFNCMVVVATNHPRQQQLGFSEQELEQSKKVFHLALKHSIGDEEIGCPPFVYIRTNESEVEVMNKLKYAKVLQDQVLIMTQDSFTDRDCSRCNTTIRFDQKEEILGVVGATGTLTSYDKSECHPQFVAKYARWQKVLGTIFHVLTFAVVLLYEDIKGLKVWPPTFTSSDEVCAACRKCRGSSGCRKINEDIDCDWIPSHGFAHSQVRLDHEFTS